MAKKAEKPAWRTRYEEANPTVSFRVSREQKDYLQKISVETGRSFADMIKAGAGILSKEQLKAVKKLGFEHVKIGVCDICGDPFYWDLTDENDLARLGKHLVKAKVVHKRCYES